MRSAPHPFRRHVRVHQYIAPATCPTASGVRQPSLLPTSDGLTEIHPHMCVPQHGAHTRPKSNGSPRSNPMRVKEAACHELRAEQH